MTEGALPPSKHDWGKARYDLLPAVPLHEVVQVLTFGSKKYDDYNYLGVDPNKYFGALLRHIFAWRRGEEDDEETGISHLAHAVCCVLILRHQETHASRSTTISIPKGNQPVLKKTITFEGLEGPIEEEFYFHLSKADILELEMNTPGGYEKRMKHISETQDNKEIYRELKKIALLAVGKRSEDGKRLIKTTKLREEFESSEAFSEMIFGLLTNENEAAQFINAVFGASLESLQASVPTATPATPAAAVPYADEVEGPMAEEQPKVEPRKITPEEIVAMDGDELKSGLAEGRYTL